MNLINDLIICFALSFLLEKIFTLIGWAFGKLNDYLSMIPNLTPNFIKRWKKRYIKYWKLDQPGFSDLYPTFLGLSNKQIKKFKL